MTNSQKPLRILWFAPLPVALLATARAKDPSENPEFLRTRSSDQQFEQLLDGSVYAVVTAIDNVVEWNRRAPDAGFRVVAQVETTTLLSLYARPEFTSPAQLKGARLLVDAPANGFVVALLALLAQAGLGRGDYSLVEAGGVTERLDALAARNGDATLLGPPFDTAAATAGFANLASVNAVWPRFPGQGLVVSRRGIAEFGDRIAAWLADMAHARDAALNDMDAALPVLTGAGVPAAAGAAALGNIPPSWRPTQDGIGLLLEHRRMVGLPGGELAYPDLVDLSLIERSESTAYDYEDRHV